VNTAPPAPSRHASDERIAPWGWALVAIRLLAMLATLLACLPLHYLAAPLTRHNPVPRWFLRTLRTIAGLHLRVHGATVERRTVFLANHVSWLDIPAIAGATGSAFVAHDGLAQIGPLRWLCALHHTVFIARHERRSVAAQIGQVREALRDHGPLTIFPEGTTSDGTGTLPFKSSLLAALEGDHGVPVRPVRLDYGAQTRTIAWVGDEPGLDNALRILARVRPVVLTLHLLPPLAREDMADRKRIAAAARAAIDAAA
jgi:1-acyl-sn-glycerol-3-phosphate acyltransferase